MTKSNTTTASYKIKTYTVTFDANGHGKAPDSLTLKKGDKVNKPKDLITEEDFAFKGWFIDSTLETPWNFDTDKITSNITLYAKWKAWDKVSDVTFSKISGEVDYKDEITLSCSTPGATIHYSIDNGEEKTCLSSANVNITGKTIKAYATKKGMTTSNTTTASYTIKTYTVTFDANGHGTAPSKITGLRKGDILTAEQLAISAPNSGFKFSKWIDANGNEVSANHVIKNDLALKANWTDVVPGSVINLTSVEGDGKVTLKWTNPADEDLSKIVISCDNNISSVTLDISNGVAPNKEMTHTINSLTNGTTYTFTIKAIDKENNESISNKISVKSPIPPSLEDTPRILKDYAGTAGAGWTYVAFGIWPQTKYSGDINVLQACANINAWDNCYTDGKGGFYVKENAKPYYSKGYENDPNKPDTMYKFSDGTLIESGKDYYFKLEPIVWRVLTDNYRGKKLLLAENALDCCPYFLYTKYNATRTIGGKTIYNNNYKESEIRAFLNSYNYVNQDNSTNIVYNNKGFLQKAFTKNAREKITNTVVDNSAESTTDEGNNVTKSINYICEDTTDKIFLLSEKEVTTASYGFDAWNKYGVISTRLREPTDYAKATGTFKTTHNKSFWLLRSPYCDYSDSARGVSCDGDASGYDIVYSTSDGVVPALSISF